MARWPDPEFSTLRTRAKILVIDDREFPYLSLFRNESYNIEKWDDVGSLSRLEGNEFDLILLDLKGVGSAQSTEHGLGILKHIRDTNPAQIVIAYSQEDWPIETQAFFKLADATLGKTDDYASFKREVDRLIKLWASPDFYVERALAALGEHASPKAHKKIRKAILRRDENGLAGSLRRMIGHEKTVDRALVVVGIALKVAAL